MGFTLTLETWSWCFLISVNSTSNLLVTYTYIFKVLGSLLFLGPHPQQMPSRKFQLVSSTSRLCFQAKFKRHISRKPFPTSTTDRSNHSFKDLLILPLAVFVLSSTIWWKMDRKQNYFYSHLLYHICGHQLLKGTVFFPSKCFISYPSLHWLLLLRVF